MFYNPTHNAKKKPYVRILKKWTLYSGNYTLSVTFWLNNFWWFWYRMHIPAIPSTLEGTTNDCQIEATDRNRIFDTARSEVSILVTIYLSIKFAWQQQWFLRGKMLLWSVFAFWNIWGKTVQGFPCKGLYYQNL